MKTRASFPVDWPEGVSRTARPVQSKFKAWTIAAAFDELVAELRRFKAFAVEISSDVPVLNSGRPRSDRREPADRGVVVRFKLRRGALASDEYVVALDRYDRVADNMHGIALTLDALRSIQRHAGHALMQQAARGFLALPAAPTGREHKLRQLAEHGATEGERAAARAALERSGRS